MDEDDFEARMARWDAMAAPAPPPPKGDDEATNLEAAETRRGVSVFKTMDTQRKMRLLSEAALADALPWHIADGEAWHVISAGDVDSLTYLRHIARDQRIDYCIVSTWCMARSDAEEMLSWVERGLVGRFDFYVGEIFKNGYRGCRDVLDAICGKCGGRVARFRNHSKVMALWGAEWSGVIESSANVDTNPRTEQTCITADRGLADFYKAYFDGINDFDGGYADWQPWKGA